MMIFSNISCWKASVSMVREYNIDGLTVQVAKSSSGVRTVKVTAM